MKSKFILLFIGALVFVSSTGYAEEESNFYHALVMDPVCGGDGKQVQGKTVEFLESFLMDSVITDENGEKKNVKSKLLENDDEKHYGERVFDFEKIKKEIIKTSDIRHKECLRGLYRLGMNEWTKYLNKLSKDYSCGLELESEPIGCGLIENKGTFTCSNDEKTVSSFSEKASLYEMDKLSPTIDKGAVNKNTCTKTSDGEDLSEFIKNAMLYLSEINDNFLNEELKLNSEKIGKESPKKTEASNCANPRDCGEKRPEQKSVELSEEAKKKGCCEYISENWTSLGFSTVKGEKPSEHTCEAMLDTEKSKESTKIAEQCIRNLLGSLGSGFVDGVKSFFSLFQAGWLSSLPTLLHELKNNPVGTMTKIMQDMIGYDSHVWSCVNDHTKVELGCAMVGKFVGSNFGFGAGVGLAAGVVKSTAKGVKALVKVKTSGESLKTLASSGKSISLRKELKEALKSSARAAAKAPTWPLAAVSVTGKTIAWGFKKANIAAAAKTIVKAPIKVVAGTTALGVGVVSKTAARVTKGNPAGAQSLDSFANAAFSLSRDQFTGILSKSRTSLATEIKSLQRETTTLGRDIKALKTNLDGLVDTSKKVNGKPVIAGKDVEKAAALDKEINLKEQRFNELNSKLTDSKVEFYKSSVVSEKRIFLSKNTQAINDLKKNTNLSSEQQMQLSMLQNVNKQLRADISKIEKANSEQLKSKLYDLGILGISTSGIILNQTNSSSGSKADDKNKPKMENGSDEIVVPADTTDEPEKTPAVESKPQSAVSPKSDKQKEPAKESKPESKAKATEPNKDSDEDELPPPPGM